MEGSACRIEQTPPPLQIHANLALNQQIKPCPLCGDVDSVEVWRHFMYWHITCNRCDLDMTSRSLLRKDAIAKWNNRKGVI